ncbi:hypothetical protein [Desulforhopalus singaporensis]|uniref:Uncharacterized protein n=1 Tax=Desulforhopalus singaporensis TaxID=91360 RepID=A0A1H0J3H5_9BACT|nr:hypothetical protein [Desulforhopalus singaporensis]SDO38020.1 hypothetical protein SAMN05660330_00125 [Desulforhopalus singaporensis]
MAMKIKAMNKVSVVIVEKSGREDGGCRKKPAAFDFIYSIRSEGLTPFEVALADKKAGESVCCCEPGMSAKEFFGHLFVPVLAQTKLPITPDSSVCFAITIADVATADNREIVRALAGAVGHGGCGGGCGCGCG